MKFKLLFILVFGILALSSVEVFRSAQAIGMQQDNVAGPATPKQDTIPIPTDIKIWGGISLAVVFNRGIVPLLFFLGLIKEENKKLVGLVLLFLGAAVGLVYSVFTAHLTDYYAIAVNVMSGALAGILAVGGQSFLKNTFEHFGKSLPKVLSNPKPVTELPNN